MANKSKKIKILLTRKLPDSVMGKLKKRYVVDVYPGPFPMPKNILLKKIGNKEGLICYPYDFLDKQVLNEAKNLRTISTFSVGYDHIDTKFAKKKNISIGFTPDVLTDTTADLTVSLILSLLRRVTEGDRLIRAGDWKEVFGADTYVGEELNAKILGILGLGRIGKSVATRAQIFGMKVIYHNKKKISPKDERVLNVKFVSMENLLNDSDILSLHIPYTKKTHEIIKLKQIKKMKKSSFLVNTSRGKIIKESDLVLALRRKLITGAALDVYQNEPLGKRHPLTRFQNVLLTPHLGSSTNVTRKKMAEITVENLILGLNYKKPKFSVY